MNQAKKDAYLRILEAKKAEAYNLLKSASNDPNAKKWEVDHYLDILLEINRMIQFINSLP